MYNYKFSYPPPWPAPGLRNPGSENGVPRYGREIDAGGKAHSKTHSQFPTVPMGWVPVGYSTGTPVRVPQYGYSTPYWTRYAALVEKYPPLFPHIIEVPRTARTHKHNGCHKYNGRHLTQVL
jgi:hypothetical protein